MTIDKQAVTAKTKELASLMVERFSMNPVSCKLLNEAWKKEFPDEVAIAERMLALLDELEHYKSREERVTKLVLDNSTSWDALYKKLEASEKRIAELVNDEVRQRLANAEHQLHMAELAKCNLRASRKAQFRKRRAAEQLIAELDKRLIEYAEIATREAHRVAELERANAAQDDHINQQQDRIDVLEKRNAELGKYAGEMERYCTAYLEWSDKTDWVQRDKRFDVVRPLGKHRADVLREYIKHLERANAAHDDHIK